MQSAPTRATIAVLVTLAAGGCDGFPPSTEHAEAGEAAANTAAVASAEGVVEITATHRGGEHHFALSSARIPSGWTTFRFVNASPSDHFVLLYRVPDAAIQAAAAAGEPLLDHWRGAITEPFQREFDPYTRGDIGYDEFVGNLVGAISQTAPWFLDPGAPATGGPGLTAAGRTSETTVELDPGTYVLECYVKDADEEFHSYRGMLQLLTVTGETSPAGEPRPTLRVALSSAEGIELTGDIRPGRHTIAIEFRDQKAHEHLQGHNAHLVRLTGGDGRTLDALADWMDWRQPGALATRAPAGAEFLGGSMEMQQGGVAYFTVELPPGDYAWIAEVPDPDGKNMLQAFSVPARQ